MNIKYPSRGSTFTPGFRNVIERQRDLLDQGDAVAIDIEATYPGYPGNILVTISADDSSHFETSGRTKIRPGSQLASGVQLMRCSLKVLKAAS